MNVTMSEVLRFVEENDVKFIRLAFCDIFGVQKNIAIMPGELSRAFETGISFDASAVRGFLNVEESDLYLVPDPGTLALLPWRPAQGRVVRLFCDIRRPDGSPFEGDTRWLLKNAVQDAQKKGLTCRIGPECEFYLFLTDEQGAPTLVPHDLAGYCDIAPLDRGENVRREICLTLEEMGIIPEASHHETGPGQHEIDFKYSDALQAADNLAAFRTVVKAVATQNGLYASFLPKPLPDKSGSGLHVNLSLARDGVNIFRSCEDGHNPEAESFMEGILRKVEELTVFMNPLPSSYHRFGSYEAPQFVTWSRGNRSQLMRVPEAAGEYCRAELRSPDPCCNPYLVFTLLMRAGLDGVDKGLPLRPPINGNLYQATPIEKAEMTELPTSLGEALDRAEEGGFAKSVLPKLLYNHFMEEKRDQWDRFLKAADRDAYEQEMYFPFV